jgi:5-deoxy-D-glucuronate isomerase
VPLADGTGESHVSCAHLESGASVNAPSLTHAAALLVVHGRITITTQQGARIRLLGGMGAVFDRDEPYSLESDIGGIVLIVESTELTAHSRGISSPDRIAGQTWPSDQVFAECASSQVET